MTKRKRAGVPTMHEKLACALLEVDRLRSLVDSDYERIPREHAKQMAAEWICSLWQFDHHSKYARDGADNHPTILTPLLRAAHREKTKRDVKAMRKSDRLAKRQAAHVATMAIEPPEVERPEPEVEFASRPDAGTRKRSGWAWGKPSVSKLSKEYRRVVLARRAGQ